MRTLTLSLASHTYPIHIGSGLLAQAGALITPLLPARRTIIVSDETVAARYALPLTKSLEAAGIACAQVSIKAGEASKSMAGLDGLLQALLAHQSDRKTTLLALGGGVVGDLCGFAASMLLRGVPFIQIPTTLLAMVDSAVGGKTGINMPSGKNLVGSFHQPLAVISDIDTLASLPLRERLAGYAEIAKMAAIMDADFWQWLDTNAKSVLTGDAQATCHAIEKACAAKADIVAQDERESKDMRALLNLGHTFGHALEAEFSYGEALRHGEAVAVGMVMAARLSHALGHCDASVEHAVAQHLKTVGLPASLSDIATPPQGWSIDGISRHFLSDKKNANGALTFIGYEALGKAVVLKNVPMPTAQAAIGL